MALVMLFPKLPLWAGVLIVACDVFVILLVGDPLRRQPVKLFEWLIAAMVCVHSTVVPASDGYDSSTKVFSILICMLVIITKIEVGWGQVFLGYVPSKYIFQPGSLYTCELPISVFEIVTRQTFLFLAIGVIGATVMPHSLFLGSALATQDRLSKTPLKDGNLSSSSLEPVPEERRPTGILNRIKSSLNEAFRTKAVDGHKNRPQRHEDRENNPYLFVKSHVYHGVVDIILSLLGVAVVINSM